MGVTVASPFFQRSKHSFHISASLANEHQATSEVSIPYKCCCHHIRHVELGGEMPVGDGGRWDAVLSATPPQRKWSTTTQGGCPQGAAIRPAWKCRISMVLTPMTTHGGGGSRLLLECHWQIDRERISDKCCDVFISGEVCAFYVTVLKGRGRTPSRVEVSLASAIEFVKSCRAVPGPSRRTLVRGLQRPRPSV